MAPATPDQLLQQLQWRYAVKRFDPTRKIPPATWAALEQSLVLAPSSFGLQPWKFFVIENPELRETLLPLTWNQSQVTQASHLVVMAIREPFGMHDIDRHVARIAEVTGAPAERFAGYRRTVSGFINDPNFDPADWAKLQVYLALGVFLASAALLGIDACPMEGFQPRAYDEVLGLADQGYASAVLATAGYRAADDRYADGPKIRYPTEEVIERIR
jgi:nitroreductase